MELKKLKKHPKCYYSTDNGVLLHGDCLEIMPELEQIDGVLTDPTYGLDKKWQGGTWFTRGVYKGSLRWDKKQPEAVNYIISIGVPSIIWGGVHYDIPPTRCHLVWIKTNNVPTMSDLEIAWTNFDRPSKKFSRSCNGWKRKHPTEKPIDLIAWCLGFLPDKGIILDSFIGSGTTAVVCERLNRRWIGIEISLDYCRIAKERIERELQQKKIPGF